MNWVMIIFIAGFYKGGATTIEGFTSRDACMAAVEKIERHYDGYEAKASCYCVEVY